MAKTLKVKSEGKGSIQKVANTFLESRDAYDFELLYNRLKPGITKYLVQYYGVSSSYDIDAIMLSTFTKIWDKLDQYNPKYAFSTWAYRIARNEYLLSKRGTGKTTSLEAMTERSGINITNLNGEYSTNPDYEYFEPTREEDMERLYKIVLDEIGSLPKVYMEVLSAQLVKKQKLNDIAEDLDLNLNTVKTRITKAKKMIKKTISAKYPRLINKYNDIEL